MTTIADMLAADHGVMGDILRARAAEAPDRPAVVMETGESVTYAQFDALADRVAAALQRDAVQPGEAIAVCALSSIPYAAVFLGGLRAGVAVAPIAPSSTPEAIAGMVADCGAKLFFLDAGVAEAQKPAPIAVRSVALDGSSAGEAFDAWLAPEGATPASVKIGPEHPFNIIYSSGTTGTPKGIVQSHGMRWRHVYRGDAIGYGPEAVSVLSTPLYSNTTLVCFFPTLAGGGTVVLMKKFDAGRYLELAQKHRMTHTMLVPVQYRRLMERPDFDSYDLSSTHLKFCTSAPFAAELKREVLERWPGGLVEYFGMTEGGGTCILMAHEHPDKLHTVGQPAPGHDIRLIDEDGVQVGPGVVGEIVGRSGATMNGYHGRPDKTAEAIWTSPEGWTFIRTGDVGRFDEDGFLTLMDRKKDMIISGGFNIYPSDLEAVLVLHPAVLEAAVVGVPSPEWGETPVAFVALKPGQAADPAEIKTFVNGQVGKTQRLADVVIVDSLPRSHIGKVLKRELRDSWQKSPTK
ncbi:MULTISPECIES: class I adenylate-forming enzyme family protein [Caulobacter]|jgi:long-chain acyl-CoA synthetase|uniref:Acyl-CoA synthetase (AMP-forming)/AMP-acid ligase II n=1 Tax=Caulobacter vibrioides OR37 TaxID=1292034 RepID=R0EJP5_CAUVI|nr:MULTISPECIES: class I adenylate-forming enzyme family protein [Caulobacter]ENZ81372.1 acyl-CoA synthetase (AMP-forming)/AMP-acid ligase II [Caulobacter vibrioides OR37]MBQ1561163.1 acyl--CoA ligase [Caulobacter sp.]